jgi:hypothetical protein
VKITLGGFMAKDGLKVKFDYMLEARHSNSMKKLTL